VPLSLDHRKDLEQAVELAFATVRLHHLAPLAITEEAEGTVDTDKVLRQ
jgi:hypothetical protein